MSHHHDHDHDHDRHHHHHDHGACCCPEHAKVGRHVDNFTLEVYDPTEGFFGEVSLKKLKEEKKWTILFFYPADFTFVCPTELDDLAAKQDALKQLGCEIIAVSTDTKFSHMAWRNSEKLLENVRYKMGADPTGNLARYYGVYDPDTGLALRGTFVINPDGVLVCSEVNFYNVGRNAEELVRKMDANAYLLGHPAEACPARWAPGQKTLTPSEKLVGKVYEALNE